MSRMTHTPNQITFTIAFCLYQKHCYTLAPRTRQIYSDHLTRLGDFLGDVPIVEINHYHLTDFMAGLRWADGREYAPGYLSQIYRSCYTFFVFCVNEGWIDKNPLARVPRPRQPYGSNKRLKLSQIGQLITGMARLTKYHTLSHRNMAILLLMLDSGLRLGEVASLVIEDFDPITKSLYVTSSKTHARREVPLHPSTIAAITASIGDRQSGPMFLARGGADGVTPNGVAQLVKRLGQKLNIKIHPHLLRHTFANFYNKKGDIRKLQKILGHSDITTTARFYSNPDFEDIQAEHREVSPLQQLKNLTT